MLISLCIVYGCFHATVVELNSCNRECMAHKAWNIYYLPIYRKSFLTNYTTELVLKVGTGDPWVSLRPFQRVWKVLGFSLYHSTKTAYLNRLNIEADTRIQVYFH